MAVIINRKSDDFNIASQSTVKPKITLNTFEHPIYDLILGNSSLSNTRIYIWIVFISLILISVIAQVLFPVTFDLFSNTISDQGSISLNPEGNIYWRIGVILNGLLHVPYILFISKKLSKIHHFGAILFKYLGIIAGISFSFVGLISLDYGISHYIFAIIAFVGYYIIGILSFILIYHDNSPLKYTLRKSVMMKIFVGYFIFSGAACLGSFFLYESSSIVIYPILEWNYLLAICLWLLSWPRILKNVK